MKLSEVKKIIATRLQHEKDDYNRYLEVLELIKQVEGLPVSKQTFNKRFLKSSGYTYINNNGNHYLSKNGRELLVGYGGVVNVESFINKFSTPYSVGSVERINQLENLNPTTVLNVFNKVEKHFNSLRALFGVINSSDTLNHNKNPVYYELLDNIYKSEGHKHLDVNLKNFHYIRTEA
ncbi:MAG: hypothetical protein GY829_05825 [Gammaproteobacteria bacterium]|nr:hypothetical protein [Gammaproteobacteria bacterium]